VNGDYGGEREVQPIFSTEKKTPAEIGRGITKGSVCKKTWAQHINTGNFSARQGENQEG
jgi:hypothetical protein